MKMPLSFEERREAEKITYPIYLIMIKKLAQSIVTFIIAIFGPNAGRIIGIFLISLLPVIELRGSIPIGYYQGLPWYTNMITSIIGNMLPVPFILLFVVSGFEHSVANMYYIPAGIIAKMNPEYLRLAVEKGIEVDRLNISSFLFKNLLPVTIGNLIGGTLVGLLYWYIYLRKVKK